MSKKSFIGSKLFVIIILAPLLTASVLTYINLQSDSSMNPAVLALPQTLSVSIEPASPVQLTINQTQVFTANISNQQSPVTYTWSVEYPSTNNSAINGTSYILFTKGNQAVFKFLEKKLDFCWLNVAANAANLAGKGTATIQYVNSEPVTVIEQQGNSGQADQQAQTQEQNQNYYQSYTYNYVTSTASYIVKTDGKGQYQVINGTDGNIMSGFTSPSADITLNSAIALGGIIAIRAGDYSGAQLVVPANATIIAEPGTTGIKYASISSGARIDEPNFNDAFGGYISGSYTIVTNKTASATMVPWYLAFKPDSSVYFASTNLTYVHESARLTLGVYGGLLTYASGNYFVNAGNSLQISNNLEVIGSGTGSTIFYPVGAATVFRSTIGSWHIRTKLADFRIEGDNKRNDQMGINFEQFTLNNVIDNIDVYSIGGTGIQLTKCYGIDFKAQIMWCHECGLKIFDASEGNFRVYALYNGIDGNSPNIDLHCVSATTISGSASNGGADGILIQPDVDAGYAGKQLTITSVYIEGNIGYGIHAKSIGSLTTEGVSITNCYFNANNPSSVPVTQYAIYLEGANGTKIIDNTFINGLGKIAIRIVQGTQNTLVKDNFWDQLGAFQQTDNTGQATNTRYENNIGFPTENYIVATNTSATRFVFDHGLAGPPTLGGVWASFNTTAVSGYTWTATSTQITITVTGTSLPSSITAYVWVVWEP